MAITGEDLRSSIANPISDALSKAGIDADLLAKKLKSELEAHTPEVIKFDGSISRKDLLPRGFKVIAKGNGKTILEANRIDIGTRQRARIDAHKLLGHYPAQKHIHTGDDEGGPIQEHITVEFVQAGEK